MGEYFNQVPLKLQDHIERLVKIAGLPEGEDSLELLSKGWLDKQESFETEIDNLGLELVESVSKEDIKGALILTYSGSLLNVGPLVNGVRKAAYASIGLREDVPEAAENNESILQDDITLEGEVVFEKGPIKKSSPIYKIAVLKENVDPEEEEEILAEATEVLTENFIEVNKTLIVD